VLVFPSMPEVNNFGALEAATKYALDDACVCMSAVGTSSFGSLLTSNQADRPN